ncbi:DUF6036 family nucleotidyltransferase [Leifsonia sp. C5G2]|uniref:DUF6036 family nucleotidyltransferase n=1 Tax=Leifsonia sp. C5G2 TaxID=2735269 RepID=UPI001584C2A5|nr:DUF6036 family nucleotidyltransferase [Leifsonia sp. C5G2]NUU06764.1 hypothetical protein [Leifsonia sp. C5G2]
MAGDRILTQEDIIWGLEQIRDGLAEHGAQGTLKIIGGSAMILGGHAERRSTVDIDAVVLLPQDVIGQIAARVAQQRGWPDNWINLEAQGLYPAYAGRPLWEASPELSHGALTVELATQEALLAMKLNASRAGRDDDDIRALMTACGIETIVDADDHFADYFRGESLPDKAVMLLRSLGYPDGHPTFYRDIARDSSLSQRRSGAVRP